MGPRRGVDQTAPAGDWAPGLGEPGADTGKLVDQALRVLAGELERERELAALDRLPYEDDAEVSWEAPPGPDLPYDGKVPDDVRRLAVARRRAAAT